MTTPNLQLVEVPAAKSKASTELNESFWILDVLVQPAVLSATTSSPPSDAQQGAKYIVAASPSGSWAGHERHVAYLTPLGWRFVVPRAGWRFQALDDEKFYEYRGSAWTEAARLVLQVEGTDADEQLLLNLVSGSGITITDNGDGSITIAASGGGGGVGGVYTPDTAPVTPNTIDDEFNFSTVIDTTGARFTGASPWTVELSTGTFSAGVNKGALVFVNASTSTGSYSVSQPISGSSWEVEIKLRTNTPQTNFQLAGMFVGRGGTKQMNWCIDSSSGNHLFAVHRWNSYTFASSGFTTLIDADHQFYWVVGAYLRIKYDGTNVIFRLSFIGQDDSFIDMYSEAASSFLGGAPDAVGIFFRDAGTGSGRFTAIVEHFRRIS